MESTGITLTEKITETIAVKEEAKLSKQQ